MIAIFIRLNEECGLGGQAILPNKHASEAFGQTLRYFTCNLCHHTKVLVTLLIFIFYYVSYDNDPGILTEKVAHRLSILIAVGLYPSGVIHAPCITQETPKVLPKTSGFFIIC